MEMNRMMPHPRVIVLLLLAAAAQALSGQPPAIAQASDPATIGSPENAAPTNTPAVAPDSAGSAAPTSTTSEPPGTDTTVTTVQRGNGTATVMTPEPQPAYQPMGAGGYQPMGR
jgi:hypothetical protein